MAISGFHHAAHPNTQLLPIDDRPVRILWKIENIEKNTVKIFARLGWCSKLKLRGIKTCAPFVQNRLAVKQMI